MFTIAPCVYQNLGCFKQPPLNFTLILLPDVAGGLIVLPDNPLDFHDEIYILPSTNLKHVY